MSSVLIRRVRRRLLTRGRRFPVAVTGAQWEMDGTLVLTGTLPRWRQRLIVHHLKTGRERVFPLEGANRAFTASLPVGRMPVFGKELPLLSGDWRLVRCHWAGGKVPAPYVVGGHEFTLQRKGRRELTLHVERVPQRNNQNKLRNDEYPKLRSLPLRDTVVFDSMGGRRYSCNPRALFEKLRDQDRDLDYVWVSADGQYPEPDGALTVPSGSKEHYEALARARYLVANTRLPHWFRKREGQTYLQCWHGTPLKTLGFDVQTLNGLRTSAWERMRSDVPQWDYLISPNPFSTPIMQRAYQYDGVVLETGYPRNDLLNDPLRDLRANRVRNELRLPPNKRVVLYAPTWRDDLIVGREHRQQQQLALDLRKARIALGDDHVVLLRAHHHMSTGRSWRRADDFVLDVSDYPDIADLYLVTDVLVTDYSSAMFDFAVTGKPMIFFAYDLERYRDEVRGFYFDLAAEAPGPLLRTSDAVIEALRAGDTGDHKQAYADFAAKFCPYDDGLAAVRVIERVWGL